MMRGYGLSRLGTKCASSARRLWCRILGTSTLKSSDEGSWVGGVIVDNWMARDTLTGSEDIEGSLGAAVPIHVPRYLAFLDGND